MAVTALLYGKFFQSAFNKEVDLDSDTINTQLHTSSYTPNQDTHRYKSDLTNEVPNGSGYTTGGITLAGVTVTYTGATNVLAFASTTNPSWPTSTFTARYAVIVDVTPGSDATRPLIGYVDFGQDMSPVNGTLSITWNAAGIATVTVS